MVRHEKFIQNLVGKNEKMRPLWRRWRVMLKITGVLKEQYGRMWAGFV
jgi:hypothetical protein